MHIAHARSFLNSSFALLALALLLPLLAGAAPQAGEWKGYIGIDAATGNVLVEDKADVVTPPASMTKLMTFAVLHDKLQDGSLSLSANVQITADDAGMGGTQVYLDPSENFNVEELIYAMMIQSANDASHALARFSAGSVETFVGLMNAKARELGMTRTTFRTPHGLPPKSRRIEDGDLTTPRDFALLCRYLVSRTDVIKYTSAKERDFGPARARGPQHMINHNKLLGRVEGTDGLKTGYTQGAGYCLSATAQRNNRRVIIVIMGCFGPQGNIDRGVSRDRKTIELFADCFAKLPAGGPAFTGPAVSPVMAGEAESPVRSAPSNGTTPPESTDGPMVKFTLKPGKK